MNGRKLLTLMILLGLAGTVAAEPVAFSQEEQDTAVLKAGDRVRVRSRDGHKRPTRQGTLLSLDGKRIVFRDQKGRERIVALSSLERLDVSRGKRKMNAGRGALIGFLSGAALGALVGALSYEECSDIFCLVQNRGASAGLGAFLGAATGGALGASIGKRRSERWQKVPREALHVQLALEPGGGAGMRLALRW